MNTGNYSKSFFRANKYQQRILRVAFAPTLLIAVFSTVIIGMFCKELISVIAYGTSTPGIQLIADWGTLMMVTIWLLFGVSLLCAFQVSKNLVGAFERVVNELDAVIEGRSKKHIHARSKDDLANELLKRINTL